MYENALKDLQALQHKNVQNAANAGKWEHRFRAANEMRSQELKKLRSLEEALAKAQEELATVTAENTVLSAQVQRTADIEVQLPLKFLRESFATLSENIARDANSLLDKAATLARSLMYFLS